MKLSIQSVNIIITTGFTHRQMFMIYIGGLGNCILIRSPVFMVYVSMREHPTLLHA